MSHVYLEPGLNFRKFHRFPRMIIGFFFLLLCPLLNCSVSSLTSSSTPVSLASAQSFSDSLLQAIENERTSHFQRNFFQVAYANPAIIDSLEIAYCGDWNKAIDDVFNTLKDSLADELVNDHLIPMHPFHRYFANPFANERVTPNFRLSTYFADMEHSILFHQLLAIKQTQAKPVFSRCHISLLNLLYKYSLLISSFDADSFHMAFIFRSAFYNYDLVLDSLVNSIFCSAHLNPSQMAQDLHSALHAHSPDIARMALKSSVHISRADLSHLSYADTVQEHFDQDMTALLPQDFKTFLESDHFALLPLSDTQGLVLRNLQQSGNFYQSVLFWIAFSDFYLDPVQFHHTSSITFWHSLLYSLMCTFSHLFPSTASFLFSVPDYRTVLDSLCEPLAVNYRYFLQKICLGELVLFGHFSAITFLLSNDAFNAKIYQSTANLILKIASVYCPVSAVSFIFTLPKIANALSEKALNSAIMCLALQGKVTALKALLSVPGTFDVLSADEAFQVAASKGFHDVLHVLVSSARLNYSESLLIAIATDAFDDDNLKIIDLIIFNSHNLKLNIRNLPFLFQLFAKHGTYDTCKTILDTEFFDDDEIKVIVEYASEAAFTHGNPSILHYILTDGEVLIAPQNQDAILLSLLRGNNFDQNLFQMIVDDCGFTFTESTRSLAIGYALKGPHVDLTLPGLIGDLKFHPLEHHLHVTLFAALQTGRVDLLEIIIDTFYKDFTQKVLDNLIKKARIARKPQFIKTISPVLFRQSVQNKYLKNAANRREIKFLFNCGFKFRRGKNKQVIKYLLSSDFISRNQNNTSK